MEGLPGRRREELSEEKQNRQEPYTRRDLPLRSGRSVVMASNEANA